MPELIIDLIVVPAICFDRRGFRIGYGKGFYDAFLHGRGEAPLPYLKGDSQRTVRPLDQARPS